MALPAAVSTLFRLGGKFGFSMPSGGSSSRNKKVGMSIDPASYLRTIAELKGHSKSIRRASKASMKAAANVLMEEVRRNMSSKAHSLADLNRLDNPYADRHGNIRSSSLGGMKPYEIHDQDGTMVNALRVNYWGNQHGGGSSVGLDSNVAPHAKWVVDGTKTMLGRDVINETLREPEVERKIKKEIVNTLKRRGPKGKFAKVDYKWTFK